MRRVPALGLMFWMAIFCTASPAGAEAPFSANELNKFLADFPSFVRFMEAQGDAVDAGSSPETWKAMRVNEKMQAFLSGKGWEPHRFFYVVSHVAAGLTALELNDRAPDIQAQLEAQKAAILNNPQISEEMKQQLIAQMQSGIDQTGSLKSTADELPPEEMALIKTHKARIRGVFSDVE